MTNKFENNKEAVRLEAINVREVFMKCLFERHEVVGREIPTNAIEAEGIGATFYFHEGRINDNKEKIISFINELPDKFDDGASFLEMAMKKGNIHWGEHKNCEQLLALGLAVGILEYVLPREDWHVFPQNLPYIIRKKVDYNVE